MAIDVGPAASDRASTVQDNTYIAKGNPANETGLITEIQIYCEVDCSNLKVAAFTEVSEDHFTTRGYTSLAAAGAGLTTYTAPADFDPFEISAGDYIGFYGTASADEGVNFQPGEGSGVWVKEGDQIPASNVEFILGEGATAELSLYASGGELANQAKINIGDAWKDVSNIKINIGDDWKQIVSVEINIGDAWKTILS